MNLSLDSTLNPNHGLAHSSTAAAGPEGEQISHDLLSRNTCTKPWFGIVNMRTEAACKEMLYTVFTDVP